jgi:hypothetical protein
MNTKTEQITAEEMHALIAERLDGWTCLKGHPDPMWMDAAGELAWVASLPNYSTDLNLCARAEAKVAEMGDSAREGYHRHLSCVLRETEPMLSPFTVATAPASARVRALYAVAMSLKAEPKP